jgi:hypothetical protein
MKTYIEIVSEVAWQNGDPSLSAFIKLNLEQEHLDLLQQAADIYAEQSNSHKPVASEGSDTVVVCGQPCEGELYEICDDCYERFKKWLSDERKSSEGQP